MKRREPVSNIMTENVLTVNINDDLHQVVEILNKKKIRHLPVVDGHSVVGILSRTDINRLTFSSLFENQEGVDEAVLEMLSIPQVMTHKPKLIQSGQSIKEVAEVFAKEEFHALPVTDNDGKLVGIVTTTDVIRYMLEQY